MKSSTTKNFVSLPTENSARLISNVQDNEQLQNDYRFGKIVSKYLLYTFASLDFLRSGNFLSVDSTCKYEIFIVLMKIPRFLG
jgi:hypothetical protein